MALFSTQRRAAATGLYTAPLIPTISLALVSRDLKPSSIFEVLEWGAIFYPLSLVLGALIGMPILYFLGSIRRVTWWTSLTGGFVIGAIIAVVIGVATRHAILVYGLQGAAAALVFWIFWRAGPEPTSEGARAWVRGFIGPR